MKKSLDSNKSSLKIKLRDVRDEILKMGHGKRNDAYEPIPDEIITKAILRVASKDEKWPSLTEEQVNHVIRTAYVQAKNIINSDPQKEQHLRIFSSLSNERTQLLEELSETESKIKKLENLLHSLNGNNK